MCRSHSANGIYFEVGLLAQESTYAQEIIIINSAALGINC